MRRCLTLLIAGVALTCHAQDDGAPRLDLAAAKDGSTVVLAHVQRAPAAETPPGGPTLRRYVFESASAPEIVLRPSEGSWNLTGQGELDLDVQNAMPWAVTLVVRVDDAAGGHLTGTVGLPAGPAQRLVLPLRPTSPRAHGMQAGPPMPFDQDGGRTLLATTADGTLDLRRIRAVRLGMPAPQAAQTVLLGRLRFSAGAAVESAAYRDIVDVLGQATRGQWPEKVADAQALRRAQAAEARSRPKPSAHADPYGAVAAAPSLDRTGWFHTARHDGRWWLVTPEGHAFFSLGVNAVDARGGATIVQGRAAMFRDLPADRPPWSVFYGGSDGGTGDRGAVDGLAFHRGRWFDFYAANLYRVDGDGWLAAWRKRSLDRLAAWGFNTLGNWSDDALGSLHRLPYTRSINISGDYGNVATGFDYWGRMPDPFDPAFTRAADAAVAKASAGVHDDPWLLGYFADNELAWAGKGPQGRWALALGTLAGEPRSHAKQAFLADLKARYGTAQKLSAAWGVALADWSALEAGGFRAPLPDEAHPALAADYGAWLCRYAEAYFRTVAQAIGRADPHHLFLGGRFAVRTPEAVAACAKYCDVVSFNVYADLPGHGVDLAAMHALDKPVLISEFHFGSDDRGPFGKGVVSVWNEAQRGEAYARFVAAAAADPVVVGAHWFEYVDQPATGRLLDGENSHIGLVGVTDLPFTGFVRAVRAANDRVTEAHANGD